MIEFVGGVNATEGSQFQVCLRKNFTTVEQFQVDISARNGTAQDGRGKAEFVTNNKVYLLYYFHSIFYSLLLFTV